MYTKTLFAQLKTGLLPTKTIAFQPIQKVSVSCYPGFWQTTVRTFVWNPRGKHWIPVYNILEADCKIVLTHHKYFKAIRGKKTDKKDAKWIADLFKYDLASGSFIPPAGIRQLRDLVSYHTKLANYTTGEKS